MSNEILEAAKYCVKCNAPLYDCRDCGAGDPLKFAKAIIDHHEKYRWHDLRKNPNDLPQDNYGEYECVELWDDGDTLYTMVFGHYIKDHAVTTTLHDIKVIAWREVELFEPEEQV